ncbi:MAG: hypothetical protein JXA66_04255 [Oligoflexia bacterium]|nr:hypothetical protein [Oligoflexia bacterium]
MDDFREFTGNSLEEAKEKARDYFNSNHIIYEMMPPKFLTVLTGKREIRIKAKKGEFTAENQEYKNKARELLEQIIRQGGFNVTIEENVDDEAIRFNLCGDDTHYFTEGRGRLLDSVQHIIVKSSRSENNDINLIIDADFFKKEREEYLKGYINKACTTVRKSNRPYILKPLNASERRIVHMFVKSEGDLESESIGDGLYKKVKISKIRPRENEPVSS